MAENNFPAPTEQDFKHGQDKTCYVCESFHTKCLKFSMIWICAKCFPWWLASQKTTEIHHHAAPYIPRPAPPIDRPRGRSVR